MLELLWLLLTAVPACGRPRRDLVLESLLLRHELAVLTRPTRTRPRARLRARDKLLWILARRWCAGWRVHLTIVTPDTVVRWHRQGWRLFWCWKSRSRGGRPHLGPEIQELIATISRENRLWVSGGKTSAECESPMLWACLNCSGSCSRPTWPGYARAATWWPRTCCCAISSPS